MKIFRLKANSYWNLSRWLARVILAGLKQFKGGERHGIPGLMFEKPHDVTEEQERLASAKWENILDRMIRAFEIIVEDDLVGERYAEVQDGLHLFGECFLALWD